MDKAAWSPALATSRCAAPVARSGLAVAREILRSMFSGPFAPKTSSRNRSDYHGPRRADAGIGVSKNERAPGIGLTGALPNRSTKAPRRESSPPAPEASTYLPVSSRRTRGRRTSCGRSIAPGATTVNRKGRSIVGIDQKATATTVMSATPRTIRSTSKGS
jgi:hypothetical protein